MVVAVRRTLITVATLLIVSSSSYTVLAASSLLGISPKEGNYYESDIIKCRDGSKSFSRDRLNDDFCDCADGTDEPGILNSSALILTRGTSACPEGKFYCRNEGSTPQLLFSSRVNDHLCDCCDGSDEYDGSISCPNTCFIDGNESESAFLDDVHPQEKKSTVSLEDLVQKLKELKMIVFLEVVLIMMAFRLLHRHIRSRRRWYNQRNSYKSDWNGFIAWWTQTFCTSIFHGARYNFIQQLLPVVSIHGHPSSKTWKSM